MDEMATRSKLQELEIERFDDIKVPAFVSVVEAMQATRVVVVDTIDDDNIYCYDLEVIDGFDNWKRSLVMGCVDQWGRRGEFKPISLDFAVQKISHIADDSLRVFPLHTVSRVVSNTFMTLVAKTRKRRVQFPPVMSNYL